MNRRNRIKEIIKLIVILLFVFINFKPLNADVYPKPIINLNPFIATSFSIHQSIFNDKLEFGNGFLFGLGLSNICINSLYVQLFTDFQISNPEVKEIYYNNHYDLVLSVGYIFHVLNFVSITPVIGGGIIFHHNNNNIQYSPHINLGCIFDINLIHNHHIFSSFDTSFQFLENGAPFFRIQIGFKNHYPIIPDIPLKSKASIQVVPSRFSPDGDNHNDLAEIRMYVTPVCKIKQWDLSILDPQLQPFFTVSGEGTIPEKVVWDGYSEQGALVESATEYPVVLEFYDDLNRKSEAQAVITTDVLVFPQDIPVESKAFIKVTPPLFSPDNDNQNDLAEIRLYVTSYYNIEHWDLTIFDPQYKPFFTVSGEGAVPDKITWDGYSDQGKLVESVKEYSVVLEFHDELDRKTEARAVITTDILVFRVENRMNITISDITFAAYSTSIIIKDDVEKTSKNLEILNRLAELFAESKEYTIRIEGHANHLDWKDPEKKKKEQEQILLPLSHKRAEAVKDTLVILGVEAERISVVGLGGDFPIVPFDDQENCWKNRRVEFVLFKNSQKESE